MLANYFALRLVGGSTSPRVSTDETKKQFLHLFQDGGEEAVAIVDTRNRAQVRATG
jgi:hypothetical protein